MSKRKAKVGIATKRAMPTQWIGSEVGRLDHDFLAASGVLGISTNLYAFDKDSCIGHARDYAPAKRKAIAQRAIALWEKFAAGYFDEEHAKTPR